MIYEFRTYNLNVGKIPEYHQIFSKKIIRRQEYSKISGHWYTETGSLIIKGGVILIELLPIDVTINPFFNNKLVILLLL